MPKPINKRVSQAAEIIRQTATDLVWQRKKLKQFMPRLSAGEIKLAKEVASVRHLKKRGHKPGFLKSLQEIPENRPGKSSKRRKSNDPRNPDLDAFKGSGLHEERREQGFGSFPTHDDYSEESFS